MRFAYFVRIAILTGLLITSAATAAPVTFGSYYDENVTPPAICSASLCTVFFSQLPSDRLLLVTNVACAFVTPYPSPKSCSGSMLGLPQALSRASYPSSSLNPWCTPVTIICSSTNRFTSSLGKQDIHLFKPKREEEEETGA